METPRRPADDHARAAALLERLLDDPTLRARFREDPAAVAREAGLAGLAGDLGEGSAMQTLEARESRSSLAGVMMAAALEGIAGVGLAHAAGPAEARAPEARSAAASAPGPARVVEAAPAPEGHAAAGADAVDDDGADDGADGDDDGPDGDDDGPDEDQGDDDEDDDEDEDEDEEDEDEPDDSDDALDETTHDQDSTPEEDDSDDTGDSDDAGDSDEPDTDTAAGDVGDAGGGSGVAPGDDLAGLDDGSSEPSDAPVDVDDGAASRSDTAGTDTDTDTDTADADGPTDAGADAVAGAASDAAVPYPGDDAPPAKVAGWMAAEARRRGLPPELPVMASLVESGVRNLNGGDRDSVGFFQMRTGIWNRGDYAGYPDRPELQLRWFLDQAEAVRKQRGGTTDPQQYGEWVADVERPAEQYRGRYQQQLDRARELLEQSGGGRPRHAAGDIVDMVGSGGALRSSPRAMEAIQEAKEYLGTPYQWGGSSPSTGFDCSGLIQYAYAKAGVRIPRTTYTQFDAPNAQHIDREHLLPGDVVFFRSAGGDVHHEGLYLGDGRFLHAPHTGDVVKISRLSEPYFAREFAGGRRFARAGQVAAQAAPAGRSGAPHFSDASVRAAMAAIQRDADEAARPGTQLYKAVRDQELLKERVLAEESEEGEQD